ncbi:MAG: hypothetical protein J1E97_03375 [Muribaculaceae bacterium]|nr:hypothetical protein [Muribaculaceae bacterium]
MGGILRGRRGEAFEEAASFSELKRVSISEERFDEEDGSPEISNHRIRMRRSSRD